MKNKFVIYFISQHTITTVLIGERREGENNSGSGSERSDTTSEAGEITEIDEILQSIGRMMIVIMMIIDN